MIHKNNAFLHSHSNGASVAIDITLLLLHLFLYPYRHTVSYRNLKVGPGKICTT